MESYGLASSAKKHELSSAELLDGEDSDERSEEVFGTVQRSKETAEKSGKTYTVLKDSCSVVLRPQKSVGCCSDEADPVRDLQ